MMLTPTQVADPYRVRHDYKRETIYNDAEDTFIKE